MKYLSLLILCAPLLFADSCAKKNDSARNSQSGSQVITDISAIPKENVFGSFQLDMQELSSTLTGLPYEIREKILSDPGSFLYLLDTVINQPEDLFMIADKSHALPRDYYPADLVKIRDYGISVNRQGLEIRKIVIADLQEMSRAARDQGIELFCSSSFRSYDYQKTVYSRVVKELGQASADRESARPGTSQHQLGTTLDFGSISDAYGETIAGKWQKDNAWKYGFSLSYPQGYEELTGYRPEIWHYRYLGKPAARLVNDYFMGIQHYFLYYLNDYRDFYMSRMAE